jgi:glycosyltransferase involved in cell wall biosynthesis
LNKNTLYITFDGLSDPLGQSQILPYLMGIAAQGFHIYIISCEKQARLEQEKETILELIEGLPITWNYILYDVEAGTYSRFMYVNKVKALAKKICKTNAISLVHCRSYLASLIGLFLKRNSNIPFVFDMRGFWADERIDGNIWRKNNLLENFLYNYFKKKEKQFILRSDAIISLTTSGMKELSKNFSKELISKKTTIIPCCTNTDRFSKEKLNRTIELPGLSPTDHLFIYTGSIGTWYYTKEMIDCMLVWRSFIPTLKLLVLTKDLTELNKVLDQFSPEERSIILAMSSSYQDVPSYLAQAKAAIFFIKPSYSKIASSPTKMAECWAMDLPIITNVGIGDNDLFFNTHQGGVLIDGFTESSYKIACEKYLKLDTKTGAYRQIALDFFDSKMAVKKYLSIYNALTNKS